MKGLTLIELLLSTAISMILIGVVFSVIMTSNLVMEQKTTSVDISQNGNVLLGALIREIRQARRIITEIEERKNIPLREIVFQDGHLTRTLANGEVTNVDGNIVTLDSQADEKDGHYNNLYIKIYQEGSTENNEIRKIINYNGDTREAHLHYNLENFTGSEDLNYLIDSNFYYIKYTVDDYMQVWRSVFTYYFTGSENLYVPYNAIPPTGSVIIEEVLEEPQIIAEYVSDIFFWQEGGVNIFITFMLKNRKINFYSKVLPRNI